VDQNLLDRGTASIQML